MFLQGAGGQDIAGGKAGIFKNANDLPGLGLTINEDIIHRATGRVGPGCRAGIENRV
jgi:hypothetical protein